MACNSIECWDDTAAQYYIACMQGGNYTAAQCEDQTNIWYSGAAGSSGGNFWDNATNAVALIGALGATGGALYNQFSGNPTPTAPPPAPAQNTGMSQTTIIIIVVVVLVVVAFVALKLFKR
jgi:hypothetical protein